jgi:hypothetical protein
MLNEANNWSYAQRKFQEWLAEPPTERDPITQKRLAEELHVHETTLSRWRHLPGFDEEVQALVLAHIGDALSEVMGAFKSEAKKGSFNHQRMYFEMLGIYTPSEKHDFDGDITIHIRYEDASDTDSDEAPTD